MRVECFEKNVLCEKYRDIYDHIAGDRELRVETLDCRIVES